jgi:hypothetical protein
MGNFVAALHSASFVPKAVLDQMLTPATTPDKKPTIYGLGVFLGGPLGKYRGLQEAGHGGDQQGVSRVSPNGHGDIFDVVSKSESDDSSDETIHWRIDHPNVSQSKYAVPSVDHNGCVIPFHVERARRALAADSSEKLTKNFQSWRPGS